MKKLQRQQHVFHGITTALDLHQNIIQYCLLDQDGEQLKNDRFASSPEQLRTWIDRTEAEYGPVQVALEASGCFLWAYDLLVERLGRPRVHVAAPSKVRIIAQSQEKNDVNDAWWLAWLLQQGWLPEAFVAEGDLRDLRIAARELRSVVDERSGLKRRLRSHLTQLGLTFAKGDWDSHVGRERITTLIAQVQAEHGVRGEAAARLWSRIQEMNGHVDYWRAMVVELSKVFEEVAVMQAELAGIGPTLGGAVYGELGDPRRYHSAKAYSKATGLTPGYRESGGRRQNKCITREGSAHVRWALTRAVVSCLKCQHGPGLAVRRWVERQCRRKAKKAVIVAAARKLAEAIWRLFNLGEAFDLRRAFPG